MEGRREIEAAKLRLTAAKRQLSSAEQIMEAAKKMMASATKEAEEAETFLKESEKRCEVISIDIDDATNGSPDDNAGRSSKKRKVSMSPVGHDDATQDNAAADPGASVATSIRQSSGNGIPATRRVTAAQAIARQSSSTDSSASAQATAVRSNVSQPNENDSNAVRHRQAISAHSSRRRSRRLNGALQQKMAEFELAVNKHRDETAQLIVESAAKGERSVPIDQMRQARNRNLKSMKDANDSVAQVGGTKLSDNEVTTRMAKAETEAVQLYIEKARTQSRSDARTTNAQAATAEKTTITVLGCGTSEANGTYTRNESWNYEKEGTWRGERTKFTMYRKHARGSNFWTIGVVCNGSATQLLYKARSSGHSSLPPVTGWRVRGEGIAPAPTLIL